MLKKLVILLTLLVSQQLFATNSMRRCVILPITDGMKNSVGPTLFNTVEMYLKRSNWCYYESNSGLIDILNKYQHRMNEYLHNPKVLEVISRKTGAGSLISIVIRPGSAGIELGLRIYGENGTDVYFNEKTLMNNFDIEVAGQTIINWLDQYNKSIPYDVRVSGVLGDSFTLDMGSNAGINSGDNVELLRPTKKKRHPLFKEIVDWETKPIGTGQILHVTEQQAQGKVLKYAGVREKLHLEDWGILKKTTNLDPNYQPMKERDEYHFGKLGQITLMGNLGTFSVTKNNASGSGVQNGMLFGGTFDGELWITRHYWLGIGLDFATANISTDTGSFSVAENSLNKTQFAIRGGYKYLPLGYFYGPQVDLIMAYESNSFSLENSISDQIVSVTYSGLILGAHASLPVYNSVRVNVAFDFVPIASYKEDVVSMGEPDGLSIYKFSVGATYSYKPTIDLVGGLNIKSFKASYDSTESNINHKETTLNAGVRFTY